MGRPRSHPRRTIDDWLAAPEDQRLECIDGELTEKASPSFEHAHAQRKLGAGLDPFDRKPGGRFPGGWWIASEVDLRLGSDGFRPDLVGWRRDHLAAPPTERPVTVRPDWVCEILSQSNASRDTVVKLRAYHHAGIPYYWIVDPVERTLVVMRHAEGGYLNALAATADETVRAEPFEAIELCVGDLFDDPVENVPVG